VSKRAIVPTIIDFCQDPELLGLTLSPAQETLLRGAYDLPLPSPEQLAIWRLCTGRMPYPAQAFGEVTVVAGARSGKDSRIAAPNRERAGHRGAGHHRRLLESRRRRNRCHDPLGTGLHDRDLRRARGLQLEVTRAIITVAALVSNNLYQRKPIRAKSAIPAGVPAAGGAAK
jgi:hypothetical protein